jgi:prepilin-type N-terminal cleavage/methylation domain-containing protein
MDLKGFKSERRTGFTLVELLVVIGIIALLISILLPALSKAQKAAQAAKCMGNLRAMAQAMQIYAAEYKGAIIGSGCTSGSAFFPQQFQTVILNGVLPAYKNGNIPGDQPIYPTDYMTPMIVQTRLGAGMLKDPNESDRFYEYMNIPLFQCPSYRDVSVKPLTSTWAGTVPAPSYVTAWAFLMTGPFQANLNLGGQTGVVRISSASIFPQTPPQYVPRISNVGDAARKIFMADGAKGFNNKTAKAMGVAPLPFGTYDLTIGVASSSWYNDNGGTIGCFTDLGPWSVMSGAYDRSRNPANSSAFSTPSSMANVDPRLLAYRHGGTRNGTFRMNAVFYDGHGESMSEIESANPSLWVPRNTVLTASPPAKAYAYPDTVQQYDPYGSVVQ